MKLSPCLWFDGVAEEAANFYTSIFKNSRIETLTRYGAAGPGAPGSVMTVFFTLSGQEFQALNGGPGFKFSPAVSFVVTCRTQEEIDYLASRLAEGGAEIDCGWVTDRFGISWQIVPSILPDLLNDPDPARSQRVMAVLLQMKRLNVAALKAAHEGA